MITINELKTKASLQISCEKAEFITNDKPACRASFRELVAEQSGRKL